MWVSFTRLDSTHRCPKWARLTGKQHPYRMHSVLILRVCHTDNELELKSKKRISQNCVFNPSPNSDLFPFSQIHMYSIRIKSRKPLINTKEIKIPRTLQPFFFILLSYIIRPQ